MRGTQSIPTYLCRLSRAAALDAFVAPSDRHHDLAGGSGGAGRGEEQGEDEELGEAKTSRMKGTKTKKK